LPGFSGSITASMTPPSYYSGSIVPVICPTPGSTGVVPIPPSAYWQSSGSACCGTDPGLGVWDTNAEDPENQGWIFYFKIPPNGTPWNTTGWTFVKVAESHRGIDHTNGVPPNWSSLNGYAGEYHASGTDWADYLDNLNEGPGITANDIVDAWDATPGGSWNFYVKSINWNPPGITSGCIVDPGYSGSITALTTPPYSSGELVAVSCPDNSSGTVPGTIGTGGSSGCIVNDGYLGGHVKALVGPPYYEWVLPELGDLPVVNMMEPPEALTQLALVGPLTDFSEFPTLFPR